MAQFSVMDSLGYPMGINLSKPPESLDDVELVQAENAEYSTSDGSLRTMAGIVAVYSSQQGITSLFHDNVLHKFFFSSNGYLYFCKDDFSDTPASIGALAGSKKPVYAMFGEAVLIASGGKLQAYEEGTISTVADSPEKCDFVTVRAGRVLVYATDSDELCYSRIGDYTDWTADSTDVSSAQFVNIGYKEQGNIVALDFLSSCIMVYKDGGKAYKIVGEPQDSNFSALPVSQTAYCQNPYAVTNIDTKSYFLGSAGFMSFLPTNTYGDVEPFEEGLNVNPQLIANMSSAAQMWHIPCRKQIWIKARDDSRVFVYHYLPRYNDGRGAFTIRNTAYVLHDVCTVGDKVYVAYGSKIGLLDDSIDKDDGKQIRTVIKGGNRLAGKHFILVMNRLLVLHNIVPGYGSIKVGKRAKQLTFGKDSPYAHDAVGEAYSATEQVFTEDYARSYRVGGGANKAVQVEFIVEEGAVSLRKFHYEYLEV